MKVNLQVADDELRRFDIPSAQAFARWAEALGDTMNDAMSDKDTAVSVRVVDEDESRSLNKRYRQCDKPTNVLAFPYEPATPDEPPYLGDIVMNAPLLVKEAEENGVAAHDHWAHLFVHAVLHLLGYDHVLDRDAERMQKRETEILGRLAIASPWT